jgi:uncharacterized protein YegP (UPF0339 family)
MLKRPHRLKIHKDRRGDFRWRLEARNGACILSSSEGYKQYRGLLRNLRLVVAPLGLPIPDEWPRGATSLNGTWKCTKRSGMPRYWVLGYIVVFKDGSRTTGGCVSVP